MTSPVDSSVERVALGRARSSGEHPDAALLSSRRLPGLGRNQGSQTRHSFHQPEVARSDIKLYLKLTRMVDTLAAPALLLAVFLATNFQTSLSRLQQFLAMRVTVRNLVYVVAF